MSQYAQVNVKFGADISQFSTAMQNAARQMQRAGQQLQDVGKSLTMNLTAPIVALGAASLYAFGQIDALKRGLITFAGSAEAAEVEFNKLREVAKLPGIGLEEAVKGSNNLQAIGISADDARTAMIAFGNAIATVGGGRENFELAIRGFGQLRNASKPLQQDLYQIANQLPQVNKLMIEAFGTNRAEDLAAMGMSGKQLADFLITELGKLPQVSGGIKNSFENMSDSIKVSLGKIGLELEETFNISGKINALADLVSRLADSFANLSPFTKGAVVSLLALAAAAGPITFAIGTIIKLLPTMMAGFAVFSSVMPYLKIAGLIIGGIAIAMEVFGNKTKEAKNEQNDLTNSIAKETIEVTGLFQRLKATNGISGERNRLIQEINSKYGTTLKNIQDEAKFISQVDLAMGNVLAKMKEKIILEAANKQLEESIKKQIELEGELSATIAASKKAKDDINKANEAGATMGEISQQTAVNLTMKGLDLQRQITDEIKKQKDLLTKGAALTTPTPTTTTAGTGTAPKQFDIIQMDSKGITESFDKTATAVGQGWEKINIAEQIGSTKFIGDRNKLWTKTMQDFKNLITQLDAMANDFIAGTITSISVKMGEALGGAKDPFKDWGNYLLESLGRFMQQMGALFIGWGINLALFKDSLKTMNPYLAIAAGVALVGIGAAISATARKGLEGSSSSAAGGYSTRGAGGEDLTLTTRLDGRDLVLSGQRTTSIGRR